MFQIIFSPRKEHATRIKSLTQMKIVALTRALSSTVIKHFSPQLNHHTNINNLGQIAITMIGISPFSDKSFEMLVQKVADSLAQSKLCELFEIVDAKKAIAPFDSLSAPEAIKDLHQPELLMEAFSLTGKDVPEKFLCPITRSIMNNPVFLTTMPDTNYEHTALMNWIADNHTNPLTREKILAPEIINNGELQKRIFSFVMDMILGKSVAHYFESSKKDMATQCSLSSNTAALFGDAKLNNELYTLSAKALRRLSNENNIAGVEKLLTEYGADNIINLQDENTSSHKTALHIAIERNHLDVAKLLIARGAKSDIENVAKETAESLARKSDNDAIRNLFPVAAAPVL